MASVTLDPTFPADSQSPRLGASDIRGLTGEVLGLFGESGVVSVTYTAPPFSAVDHTTGLVQVQANPTAQLGIVTKQYADNATGAVWTGTAAGTDTYTVTVLASGNGATFANLAAAVGELFVIKFTNANTTAATLNVDAGGAKPIVYLGNALTAGLIGAGTVLLLEYDGTSFNILGGQQESSVPTGTKPVALFDRSVGNPAVDVVSSIAETTLYTKSIPGGTLGTDGALRVTMLGDFLNNTAGTVTYDLKAKFGATTILDGTTTISTQSANHGAWRFDFILSAAGATNAQYVQGLIHYVGANGSAGSMGSSTSPVRYGQYQGLAIDSTTAQTLAVTITQNTSSASVETRMFATYVELIQP